MGREMADEEEAEDARREAAIASAPSLKPNFKPSAAVTQAQLSKFQELHKRRLQLKAKSKIKRKSKGIADKTSKFHQKDDDAKDFVHETSSKTVEDPIVSTPHGSNLGGISSLQHDNASAQVPKKRQKLHWGLDTKERWERKSNM